jgi:hypothetical protein
LSSIEIIVFGRNDASILEQRIRKIILESDFDYLSDYIDRSNLEEYIGNNMSFYSLDLLSKKDNTIISGLKSKHINYFFHIAALTDFRNTEGVKELLDKTNVEGTKAVLDLVKQLNVGEFCYVGSAYSCGYTSGIIPPDYINFNQDFRNHYEYTKLLGEVLVREECSKIGLKFRVFRSSTICGRLIEGTLGSANKFDVFYAFAAFFTRLKSRTLSLNEIYDKPMEINCRILYNQDSGLNIVPADYCAKVMNFICNQSLSGDSFYLTNEEEVLHSFYINKMLESVNVKGVVRADKIPSDPNQVESFYHKTIGNIFNPYVISKPMLFNHPEVEYILKENDIKCPEIDINNFNYLMEFAKKSNFNMFK